MTAPEATQVRAKRTSKLAAALMPLLLLGADLLFASSPSSRAVPEPWIKTLLTRATCVDRSGRSFDLRLSWLRYRKPSLASVKEFSQVFALETGDPTDCQARRIWQDFVPSPVDRGKWIDWYAALECSRKTDEATLVLFRRRYPNEFKVRIYTAHLWASVQPRFPTNSMLAEETQDDSVRAHPLDEMGISLPEGACHGRELEVRRQGEVLEIALHDSKQRVSPCAPIEVRFDLESRKFLPMVPAIVRGAGR